MLKRMEVSDPNSCLNKAKEDEFIFVLREVDITISGVIRYWASERVRLHLNEWGDEKIKCALAEADAMDTIRGKEKPANAQTA